MLNAISGLISTVSGKVMIGVSIALLVLCGIFYYLWSSSQTDITNLNAKVNELSVEKKSLQDSLDKLKKSTSISDTVQNDDVKEKLVYKNVLVENKAATEAKVKAVEDKYKQLQATAENEKAKQEEISNIRLNDMWSNYCSTAASAAQCSVKDKK